MSWTAPIKGLAGSVITEAWSVANVVNLLNWLRLMTGNADPPGSGYVVVSDSTSATTWAKVGNDALATDAVDDRVLALGAAAANLGYAPVNKTGDVMSNALTISRPVSGVFTSLTLSNTAGGAVTTSLRMNAGSIHNTTAIISGTASWAIFDTADNTALLVDGANLIVYGAPAATKDVAGRVADANALGGVAAASYSQVGHTHGTGAHTHAGTDISADSITASQLAPDSVGASEIAAGAVGLSEINTAIQDAGAGTPSLRTLGTAATQAAPGNHAHGGAGGPPDVPPGLIALWDTGTPPSGWAFYTTYNGRFVIAADGVTYPLGATGGATTHGHTSNMAHGHTDTIGASLSGSITADASTAIKVGVVTPGDANAAQSGHGHAHTFTVTKSGGVSALANPSPIASDTPSHLPPYVALNYVKKS